MDRNARERTPPVGRVEIALDAVHKNICKAAFAIVMMLVKRKLSHSVIEEEAIPRLKAALEQLESLIGESNGRTTSRGE